MGQHFVPGLPDARPRYFRLFRDRLEYYRREADFAAGESPRGVLLMCDVRGVDERLASEEAASLLVRLDDVDLELQASGHTCGDARPRPARPQLMMRCALQGACHVP